MPALLYDGRQLVKPKQFKHPSYIGDPINAIKIYNDKEVDELILLDIKASQEKRPIYFQHLKNFASECFMPFAYGGGVKSIEDFQRLYREVGAEKVIINSLIFESPEIVKEAVGIFGSQAVVASIDYKTNFLGKRVVYSHTGHKTKKNLLEYCLYVQNELGVGELFVTSASREGTWSGFDKSLYSELQETLDIPIIAHGGAGSISDVKEVLYGCNANGAALGSMAIYQKKDMGVLIGFPKRSEVIQDE